jgi:hypothetical protein
MPDYLEVPRHVIQLFGAVFPEPSELPPTVRALAVGRSMHTQHPRQLRRQHPCWTAQSPPARGYVDRQQFARRRCFGWRGYFLAGEDFSTRQWQLRGDARIDDFRGATEAPAPKADYLGPEGVYPARVLNQKLLELLWIIG